MREDKRNKVKEGRCRSDGIRGLKNVKDSDLIENEGSEIRNGLERKMM